MTDLVFAHARRFPATDLSKDTVLVVPDDFEAVQPVVQLADLIGAEAGQVPEVIAQKDFSSSLFSDVQVIACGNMVNNAALRRLYGARCCFADTFFPGGDGYFIKSISDPFGHGKNCIALGASNGEGVLASLTAFEDLVRRGDLQRVHAARIEHSLPPCPDEAQLEQMIQADLDTWKGIWVSTPFRGGQVENYAWYYYLSDHPVWGRAVPAIFARSLEHWLAQRRDYPETYHCFFHFHSLIHLWDLIEDSPLYSEEDRLGVVRMMGEMLRHLADLFYLREEVNPAGHIRQNHTSYIAMDLAAGHDYMSKRYGVREFAPTEAVAERIFSGQDDCYKVNDDGGVGYAWLVPQETLSYSLLKKDDYSYIEEGHIADLCNLVVVTTDNMRSESNHGDTAGYALFSPTQGWEGRLWPLMVSTWYTRNPEHLWILNWLGAGKRPTLLHVLRGLYAGIEWGESSFTLEDCAPEEPLGLLGIYAIMLPAKARHWVERYAPGNKYLDPGRDYFDKLSMRPDFDAASEYLLLEGSGTFCHGHEDSNTIIRLTWNERAWLGDGDYIRAAPKFHNSVAVIRDGVGVLDPPGEGLLMPLLAALNCKEESAVFGMVQTEASGYNGVDWRRNIFWSKGRYFVVIDQLQCTAAGDFRCYCFWRLVGTADLQGTRTCLQQEGEQFYLHNASGATQEIVADAHEKSRWKNYPHAGDMLQILHQQAARDLQPGESLAFANLLTPHPEIEIERLSEMVVKISDAEETIFLGVGPAHLGELLIEAEIFRISLAGDRLILQGIRELGFAGDEDGGREVFEGGEEILVAAQSEAARRIIAALEALAPAAVPPGSENFQVRPEGGWKPRWSRELGGAEIGDLDASGGVVLAGTTAGKVLQLGAGEGETKWEHHLEMDGVPSALLLADIDGDGEAEGLVGTDGGRLVVLEGHSGAPRWCRALKNSGWGSRISGLAVADLQGSGRTSILAATVGWYVNAFAADATLEWAEWVRYHAITGLAAADVDGDGRAEVIAGTEYSTPLNVHNSDGSLRWTTFEEVGSEGNATTPRRGIGLTHMQLADLDRDGVREIIYGTQDGWIYAVKPQDGAELWRANIVGEVVGLIAFPSAVVAASEYGELYSFDHRGELRWHYRIGAWIRASARVGEYIAAAVGGGGLLAFDADGRCVAAIDMEAEISSLKRCEGGVVCALAGGQLSLVELQIH